MSENSIKPAIRIPGSIQAPMPEVQTLRNGIKLYSLDCTEMDVIRVSFVFAAGTSAQEKPFSASATANLLSEGTAKHSAQEIAEILDFYGSYFDVSIDRDYAVITFVSLSKFFGRTLDMAREILLEPSFDRDEIDTYKAKRKQRLAIERSKIGFRARELFTRTLFGPEHPYGISFSEDCYDALTREDILLFFERFYTANNCFVVCSGKVDRPSTDAISTLAEALPGAERRTAKIFPAPATELFAFLPHENAIQSAIRVGRILFPRNHPDFIPMQVASTVLGGYFGSRLVHNLREEHGYTYGAFSTIVNLDHAGYLAISTEVAMEVTADALRQIFVEITRMSQKDVPADELEMVRNIMTGEIMRILDGPFGIADVTIENVCNGTDNSYLEKMLQRIRAVTPAEVKRVSEMYMAPSTFTTVVVGEANIRTEIEAVLRE